MTLLPNIPCSIVASQKYVHGAGIRCREKSRQPGHELAGLPAITFAGVTMKPGCVCARACSLKAAKHGIGLCSMELGFAAWHRVGQQGGLWQSCMRRGWLSQGRAEFSATSSELWAHGAGSWSVAFSCKDDSVNPALRNFLPMQLLNDFLWGPAAVLFRGSRRHWSISNGMARDSRT